MAGVFQEGVKRLLRGGCGSQDLSAYKCGFHAGDGDARGVGFKVQAVDLPFRCQDIAFVLFPKFKNIGFHGGRCAYRYSHRHFQCQFRLCSGNACYCIGEFQIALKRAVSYRFNEIRLVDRGGGTQNCVRDAVNKIAGKDGVKL